jgi:hypothetical protein
MIMKSSWEGSSVEPPAGLPANLGSEIYPFDVDASIAKYESSKTIFWRPLFRIAIPELFDTLVLRPVADNEYVGGLKDVKHRGTLEDSTTHLKLASHSGIDIVPTCLAIGKAYDEAADRWFVSERVTPTKVDSYNQDTVIEQVLATASGLQMYTRGARSLGKYMPALYEKGNYLYGTTQSNPDEPKLYFIEPDPVINTYDPLHGWGELNDQVFDLYNYFASEFRLERRSSELGN